MSAGQQVTARSLAGFALITLIWGSTWLVIKDQLTTVPLVWSVTWRFALAAIGMFALARWRGERLRLTRRELALAALVGVIQFGFNFQFLYRSELHLTSGLVAVLFALMLVPNALLARLLLGQAINRRFLAGSAVAIAGIALLLLHEYRVAPPHGQVALGVLFAGISILSASGSNVLQASEGVRRIPPCSMLAWAMLAGVLADGLFALWSAGPPQISLDPRYLGGVAWLAIAGSVVTFPIFLGLLHDWGPGRAAYSGVLIPVIAMGLSTLFEGYRWTPLAAAGSMLAMAGLVIALSGRK